MDDRLIALGAVALFMLAALAGQAQAYGTETASFIFTADKSTSYEFSNHVFYINVTNKLGSAQNAPMDVVFQNANIDLASKELTSLIELRIGDKWVALTQDYKTKLTAKRSEKWEKVHFNPGETRQFRLSFQTPINSHGEFLFIANGEALDPWWNGTYRYVRQVDLNNTVAETLVDFPAFFTMNTSALIAAGKMQSSCNDVRMTLDNVTLLDFEIANNTCNTGSTEFYVRIPSYTASSIVNIWVFYGSVITTSGENKTGVWQPANYTGVFHLSDLTDSVNDTSLLNMGLNQTPGRLGIANTAYNFSIDSTNLYRNNPSNITYNNNTNIFAVFYPTSLPAANYFLVARVTTSATAGKNHFIRLCRNTATYCPSNTDQIGSTMYGTGVGQEDINLVATTTNTWQYYSYNASSATPQSWGMVNATYISTNASAVNTGAISTTTWIGAGAGMAGTSFRGYIDEVRFSNTTRSQSWQTAEQNSLLSTSYSVGAESTHPFYNGTNIDVFDEDTQASMQANITAILSWSGGQYSITGNNTPTLFFDQGYANSTAAPYALTIYASAGGYTQRVFTYYFATYDSLNATLNIYLSNSTSTTQIIVKGTNGQGYAYGLVSIERLYVGTYIHIGNVKLDYLGQAVGFPLTANTVIYRFNVSSPVYVFQKDFPNQAMLCPAGSTYCTVTLSLPLNTQSYYWQTYNLTSANCTTKAVTLASGWLNCSYNDTSGIAANYTLTAWKMGTLNNTQLCTNSSTNSSGILRCYLGTTASINGSIVNYVIYAQRNPSMILLQDGFDFRDLQAIFAVEATFGAWMFTLAVGLAGIANPALGIIGMLIGLYASEVMGVFKISWTALAGIGIVGAVIGYLMRS